MEKSLIQLSTEIDIMLQDSMGEVTEVIQEQLKALASKADSAAYVLERLEKSKEFYDQRADLYKRMAKSHQNAQDRLKEYIKTSLEISGSNELIGQDFRFKTSKSAPKVVIDNENDIPEEFKATTVITTPDKKRIAKALEAGGSVSGAHLEHGVSLRCYPNKP